MVPLIQQWYYVMLMIFSKGNLKTSGIPTSVKCKSQGYDSATNKREYLDETIVATAAAALLIQWSNNGDLANNFSPD